MQRPGAFLLIQPDWVDTEQSKTTADPSTSLRFAQDDSSRVMQFFGAGSIRPAEKPAITESAVEQLHSALFQGAEQAAEKVLVLRRNREKHPFAARAALIQLTLCGG
jgi:hypothetical protein